MLFINILHKMKANSAQGFVHYAQQFHTRVRSFGEFGVTALTILYKDARFSKKAHTANAEVTSPLLLLLSPLLPLR